MKGGGFLDLALVQEKIYFVLVRIERIGHRKVILAFQGNRIPVDDIREVSFLKLGYGLRAAFGPGILRRSSDRFLPTNGGIKLTDGLGRLKGKKQALIRIHVVIFKIET